MPAQDRVRLNDARQAKHAWPEPCHPDQQRSIGALKPEAMPCLPQRDIELVPQIQVLDFKAARRLEPVGDERNEQVHQGKHREAECADSALTCQDRVDRIFGNDT